MNKNCRIGCVGLLSDLPLYVAQATGIFREEGVEVTLSTELGWASLESRLSAGRLHAANVPALLPLALSAGATRNPAGLDVLAITSQEGLALCLSAPAQAALSAPARPARPVRIGVESPYSLAGYFLQAWLKQTHPGWLERISVQPVAVSQVLDLLRDGHLQGYCGAEPAALFAAEENLARTVARSRELFPRHVHSALVVTEPFRSSDPAAAQAVAAAIERARRHCAQPENQPDLLQLLPRGRTPRPTNPASSGPGSEVPFSTLIRFEGDGPEPAPFGRLEPLVRACLALPGSHATEAELTEAAKRLFGGRPKAAPLAAS